MPSNAEGSNCVDFRSFSRLHHKKTLVFVFAAFLLIVLIFFCVTLSPESGGKKASHGEFKLFPVEQAIDLSVDPCQDFYVFCCGRWNENYSSIVQPRLTTFNALQHQIDSKLKDIVSSASVSDDLPRVVNSAISFYKSCLSTLNENPQHLESLHTFFRVIGGWPILEGDKWNEEAYDWSLASPKILRTFGIDTVVGMYVTMDDKNSSHNVILIGKPDFSEESLSDISVKGMLYSILLTLGSNLTDQDAQEVSEIAKLEQDLKNLLQSNNNSESYETSIAELQKEIPLLDWLEFIQTITNDTLHPLNQTVGKEDKVVVRDKTYLKEVIDVLQSKTLSKRTVANFFGWLVVQDTYMVIPGVLQKYAENHGFQRGELVSLLEDKCFEKVTESFEFAFDYLYIKSVRNFETEKSVELVRHLKRAFKNQVDVAKWLDAETKLQVLAKLDSMLEVVGYPDILSSKERLNEICEMFPVMTDNAFENLLLVKSFFIADKIRRLKTGNDRLHWTPLRPVTMAGAYYVVQQNTLVVPISLHNPPFFYENGPSYMNFGAIGSIIGHEITHGFDNLGHKRDKVGNLKNWWSNTSLEEYNKRLTCFEEQFGNYTIPSTNQSVDSIKTLGENVADSGGLRQAYEAYKEWEHEHGKEKSVPGWEQYTSDQMFFISFASIWCSKMDPSASAFNSNSVHSPPELRVIGSVSNVEHFAKVFNCAKGTPMNPEHKCSVW